MEILILHPGALGDIILSLPALSLLHGNYPLTRLTFAANVDFADAVAMGYADRVISISTIPLHHLYSRDPLPENDLHFWKSYDRVVSWTGAGNAEFAAKLAQVGADICISHWKPDSTDKRHVARIFVESLYPWIPPVQSIPRARIQIKFERLDEAQAWLTLRGWTTSDRLLAMHPGAGSPAKRWDLANFRNLADRHLLHNGKLLIAEGPAEAGVGRELARALAPERTFLAESLPLVQLAALLTLCRAYVGNDSGISHLAAGVGIRSVVLCGPTSPEQWAPLGDHVTVVRGACLGGITPDRVWDALKEIYD